MKLKNQIMELIGLILGDGYMPKHQHSLYFYGDADEDKEYLGSYIYDLVKNNFNLTPRYYLRTSYKNGYKAGILQMHNKKLISYLTDTIGLTRGSKVYTAKIPEQIITSKNINFLLRGLFDADGCLYFSYSKYKYGYPTYPRLDIKTSSKTLAYQVLEIMNSMSFEARIRRDGTSFIIYISGPDMVDRWMSKVGSSSRKNLVKYLFWKRFGYHIPNSSTKIREERLSRVGELHSPPSGTTTIRPGFRLGCICSRMLRQHHQLK